MASPRIESVGAEPREGPAVARSPVIRPRDRWRFMNSTPDMIEARRVDLGHRGIPEPRRAGRRPARRSPLDTPAGQKPVERPADRRLRRRGSCPILELAAPQPPFALHPQTDPVPVLGPIDRLDELVDRARATHVVVAVSGKSGPHSRPPGDSTYQFRRCCALGLGGFRPARPRVTDRLVHRDNLVTALGHAATSPTCGCPAGTA